MTKQKEQQRRAKATAKREARRARKKAKAAREPIEDAINVPLDPQHPEESASPTSSEAE